MCTHGEVEGFDICLGIIIGKYNNNRDGGYRCNNSGGG